MSREKIWNLVGKKLASEASPEELDELERILREDPDLHYALQNITDIWQLKSRESPDAEEAFRRHLEHLKAAGLDWEEAQVPEELNDNPVNKTKTRKRLTPALSIIFLLILSGGIYFTWLHLNLAPKSSISSTTSSIKKVNEIHTNRGSKMKVTLPDGSSVWLNAGSRLTYDKSFGQTLREVELSGEAFFDVTRNKKVPFLIHTESIDVKVTGTAFNVKSYPGDKTTETSLIRGSVEVTLRDHPNEKYFLKPNDKLVLINGVSLNEQEPSSASFQLVDPVISMQKVRYSRGDTLSIEAAWINNRLSFEDESFEEVARKLERWYDVEINFENTRLKAITLKGSFTTETLEQAMEALKYVYGFHYEIRDHVIRIY